MLAAVLAMGFDPSLVLAEELVVPAMPKAGTMVFLSPAFQPATVMGMTISPKDPFQFDFLIQRGDGVYDETSKQQEYRKLIKYFLAALTVPDHDQWVNLSPYEQNRIIEEPFGRTEMGRDLLAQDYLLKQITSSLMYPGAGLGQAFWDRVYAQAGSALGKRDIPVNAFHKVWIVPDDVVIYENRQGAVILKSHLKIMLEEDYLSSLKHKAGDAQAHFIARSPRGTMASSPATPRGDGWGEDKKMSLAAGPALASQVMRDIILPELEKEVNEGKNFAPLRQIVSAMLMATWYKKALKGSLLGQVYADKGKVGGVSSDPKNIEKIYAQYLDAFKKGVFNLIKEDQDQLTHQVIPRKYFAGGFSRDEAMVTYVGSASGDEVDLGDGRERLMAIAARKHVRLSEVLRASPRILPELIVETLLYGLFWKVIDRARVNMDESRGGAMIIVGKPKEPVVAPSSSITTLSGDTRSRFSQLVNLNIEEAFHTTGTGSLHELLGVKSEAAIGYPALEELVILPNKIVGGYKISAQPQANIFLTINDAKYVFAYNELSTEDKRQYVLFADDREIGRFDFSVPLVIRKDLIPAELVPLLIQGDSPVLKEHPQNKKELYAILDFEGLMRLILENEKSLIKLKEHMRLQDVSFTDTRGVVVNLTIAVRRGKDGGADLYLFPRNGEKLPPIWQLAVPAFDAAMSVDGDEVTQAIHGRFGEMILESLRLPGKVNIGDRSYEAVAGGKGVQLKGLNDSREIRPILSSDALLRYGFVKRAVNALQAKGLVIKDDDNNIALDPDIQLRDFNDVFNVSFTQEARRLNLDADEIRGMLLGTIGYVLKVQERNVQGYSGVCVVLSKDGVSLRILTFAGSEPAVSFSRTRPPQEIIVSQMAAGLKAIKAREGRYIGVVNSKGSVRYFDEKEAEGFADIYAARMIILERNFNWKVTREQIMKMIFKGEIIPFQFTVAKDGSVAFSNVGKQSIFSKNVTSMAKEGELLAALLNQDAAQASNADDLGGIDLDPAHFNMRIKRDAEGVVLPAALQDLKYFENIQGLVPNILEIKPAEDVPILREIQQEIKVGVQTPHIPAN